MVKDINSEQEGRYDILQNGAGEILIIIKYREGGPENPRLVYDGGAAARARFCLTPLIWRLASLLSRLMKF